MTISVRKINIMLIYILVFVCVIFPADIHNIKTITFVLLMAINAPTILSYMRKPKMKLVYFWGMAFPVILIAISMLLGNDFMTAFSACLSPFFLLLIIVIERYHIDYEKILYRILMVLLGCYLFVLVTDLLGIFDINSSILRRFFYKYEMGYMGKSSSYSFYYKFFWKTCPLLLLLFGTAIKKKQYMLVLLSGLALVISGTRSNVAAMGIVVVCTALIILYSKQGYANLKKVLLLVLLCTIAYAVVNAKDLYQFVIDHFMNENNVTSNMVRQNQLDMTMFSIQNSSQAVFVGTGIGGFEMIELSVLYLVNSIGLVFTIIYLFFLCYPLTSNRIDRFRKAEFVAYLFAAFWNPLLFNSTAYLVYILLYSSIVCTEKAVGTDSEMIKMRQVVKQV